MLEASTLCVETTNTALFAAGLLNGSCSARPAATAASRG